MKQTPPTTAPRLAASIGVLTLALGSACSTGEATASTTTVEITATDFAFEGIPTEVTAGSTLSLTNASETELHELVVVPLAEDETRSAEDLASLPPDQLGPMFADVSAVVVAPPTGDGKVVKGDATLSTPGRYLLVCMIPTGADPDAYMAAAAEATDGPPEVDGGPPHIVHGMYGEITVVAE